MRTRLAGILEAVASGQVIVVGDLIIDEYIIGDSERISPEAPEPVITERERQYVPGGAANVAVNVHALGSSARLFGVIGDDADGDMFLALLKRHGIDSSGIIETDGRPTTRKTRMIARGSQVLRVDRETTAPVSSELEKKLLAGILDAPEEAVIVSDYAKGVVTASLIQRLVEAGKKVIVDPKSGDFSKYAGAYLLTPNAPEICRAAEMDSCSPLSIEEPVRTLMTEHSIQNMLVTLGSDGMALVEGNHPLLHIHAMTREVYDVTGAGDTVIAAVSAAVAGGKSLTDACYVANIAAGIVVGKHRTAVASPQEIMSYAFGPSTSDKIVDRETLARRLAEIRKTGRRIVFTNGCFDLLHVGHITYLNDARGLGDILVIGLNTDRSIRALKGDQRPIISQEERSHMLAALECVDFVVLFDEDTPVDLISLVRPDILAKGADYTKDQVVGADIVEAYGGSVSLIPLVDNISTTTIINKIRNSN